MRYQPNRLLTTGFLLAIPIFANGATFTITDLGQGTAVAINDFGEVLVNGGGGYIWNNGNIIYIQPPTQPQSSYFSPHDINNSGTIAGEMMTMDGGRAFTWFNGVYSPLPSLPFQGANELKYSTATSINDVNQVIGSIVMPAYVGEGVWRATTWQSGAISSNIQWETLAGSYPNAQSANSYGAAINDLGHVVGTSQSAEGWRPFIYKNGQMTELLANNGFDIASARPTAINDLGTIVGEGIGGWGGFMLMDGAVKSIGFDGGTFSKALSVNDSNYVVGMATVPDEFQSSHAFLFDGNNMLDLSLLPEVIASGWTELSYANDINNVGQIVGYGVINGEQHAFLLTEVAAVPEPETWSLMLLGLAVMGAVAKRRKQYVI